MNRLLAFPLVFGMLLWSGAPLAGQNRVAPCYSLPPDGTWIEFAWQATGPDDKERTGSLRISSVGKLEVSGVLHRWIEIKRESKGGNQPDLKLRKLLIAEKGFAVGQALDAHVTKGFAQRASGAPIIRLTPESIREFMTLGIKSSEATLAKVNDNVEIETKLGKHKTRHVSASDKSGQRTLEYHGWLTNDVPFGCSKFEIHERDSDGIRRLIFTASATRQGQNAKSELDERASVQQ